MRIRTFRVRCTGCERLLVTFPPSRYRVAELQLRAAVGSRRARVYWPGPTGPPRALLMLYDIGDARRTGDVEAVCRSLSTGSDFVVVSVRYDVRSEQRSAIERDAMKTLEWVADHAAELDADPARLFVAGHGAAGALAATLRRIAREQGWPPVLPYQLQQ